MFCGLSRRLTAEHIWPQWTSKFIPHAGDARMGFHYRRGRTGTAGFDSFFDRVGEGKVDATAMAVCEVCHPILSREFESQPNQDLIGSFIANGLRELDAQEATRLAAWCTKTTMTAEYYHRPEHRNIPSFLYKALWDDRTRPPPSVEVWMAEYRGDTPFGISHRSFRVIGTEVPSDSADLVTAFSSTTRIGHLAYKVMWVSSEQDPIIVADPATETAFLRVWPNHDQRSIPRPDFVLDDQTFETFARMSVQTY